MLRLSNIELQFNRASLSDDDTCEAYQYLDAYIETSHAIIKRGLIVAAIVAYSRPFLKSDGSGATPMVSLKLEKDLSPDELELHKKILNLRNRVAAHSDHDLRPVNRIPSTGTGFGVTFVPIDQVLEELDHIEFKNLAYKTMILCKKKARELNDKLREGDS
ncbi:hypothetical protein IB234_23395 [Pseudomonas sp. PDM16]|uniref:hypothetical protein n=1 Tax=Pseudomonas sp. PDM16 TaxID=2769292 RepID=UPI00177F61BB|nr:hypothetical protein [Pseudomonas sp. PDM16]MBD9417521.1 hypothetical protein [Pseudomonas sp. PDM16]